MSAEKPEGRSVWVSVVMTLIALMLAKGCVACMKDDARRSRSAHVGGRR